MNRNEYCDRVLAQVGRLTADEANDLRNELAGHIEDHAEALVEHGYTEEDAAARAVALMGDPEETGRALREQYRHFWLVIVQRIAIFVTIVACVQGFFMLPMLSGVYESLRERVSPTVNSISWEELDGRPARAHPYRGRYCAAEPHRIRCARWRAAGGALGEQL